MKKKIYVNDVLKIFVLKIFMMDEYVTSIRYDTYMRQFILS